MSQTYIIEVRSQAAGIVVRNPEGFVFFAASHRFVAMMNSANSASRCRSGSSSTFQ